MREYKLAIQEEKVLSKVICNGCGKEIPWETADHFHGEKTWGYFLKKTADRTVLTCVNPAMTKWNQILLLK